MEAKTLGMIQIVLAVLAVIFTFWQLWGYLPILLLALAFVVVGYHHLTEKKILFFLLIFFKLNILEKLTYFRNI